MNDFKTKLKKSYFIVNKIYLFIIFVILFLIDSTIGFSYFLLSTIILLGEILTSRLPMRTNKYFPYKTYIYKKYKHISLKIDIWYPLKNSKKNYPLIFFCHGGGWISGFRNQPNNVSWCKYLASKGFCVSSIDYRYGIKHNMKDILSDYTCALNFVKNNSKKLKINKNNIILLGLSAGGHLALLYATYNSFIENTEKMKGIKSVIAYYPPTNLNDMFLLENKSIFARFSTIKTLKSKPLEKKELYDYYSPINWISNKMIPCLIAHGALDTTVPFNSSVKFIKKLKSHGIDCQFLVHKQGNHSFDTKYKDSTTVDILEKTVNFIVKNID